MRRSSPNAQMALSSPSFGDLRESSLHRLRPHDRVNHTSAAITTSEHIPHDDTIST